MILQEITVHAGRTFNHPYERFANFRFDLSLKATLQGGDDAGECLVNLQRLAETFADEHKARLLKECDRLHHISGLENLIRDLKMDHQPWMSETAEERAEKLKVTLEKLAELKAMPAYSDAESVKEIHPGHPDHQDTDAHDADLDP